MVTLALRLEDHATVDHLVINSDAPLSASSWSAVLRSGKTVPLAACRCALEAALGGAFVSVAQERDGTHRFVSGREALDGSPLSLLHEAEVKARVGATLLYARADRAAPAASPSAVARTGVGGDTWPYPELTPHGSWTNYSVVPWLSLGPQQALILCDEATLCRECANEGVFAHLALVVNCHEASPDVAKYKAGSPWPKRGKARPAVVAHAVHKWYSGNSAAATNAKNDAIQRDIWAALSGGGTVAVHCLAGIHRAACIVACHFLYRHYTLGHDVPADCSDIYRRLQSVRPAVSPAYVDILKSYEHYVKSRNAAD